MANVDTSRSSFRILVVDDYDPWRQQVRDLLQAQPEVLVAAEVADGLEAVQKAQELQPDLILLDIGLPSLNGIEAASRICQVAPSTKIIFVSQNTDKDIVRAALNTGAQGYVLKADAAGELLTAIAEVLDGSDYVSGGLNLSDAGQTEDA